ncbi:MAG: SUMF1/EgtB/PvdO family nonheme iron enzyme [Bacteroidota bacterium]
MKSGAKIRLSIITFLMLVAISTWAQKVTKEKTTYFKTPKGFKYIPQGNVLLDKDSTHLFGFYMLESEVSNIMYKEFLDSLKAQGKTTEFAVANVDTLKWRDKLAYNEPFVSYYFQHPAYQNYPVVNISYEGAVLYCQWLTEKLNKQSKGKKVKAQLPSRAQWVWAARNGTKYNVYSWNGPYLFKNEGGLYCNYYATGDQCVHYNSETKEFENIKSSIGRNCGIAESTDIMTPVRSYLPSKFGLYNMNGNVAEMVHEKGIAVGGSWKSPGYDVRNESMLNYTEASTTVGFRPILVVEY